jgi:phosphonate transport system permease protein
MTPVLGGEELARLRTSHGRLLRDRRRRRIVPLLGAVLAVIYLIFCWSFFNFPGALGSAQWDRAGNYVADWYSWEASPRFRFGEDRIAVEWTRSLLGDNPDPDWIRQTGSGGYTVLFSDRSRIEIERGRVRVHLDGVSYLVEITSQGALLPEGAPPAMALKSGRVTVDFGFAGLAEIRSSQVYVRKRFLGWPNFFFDTRSPFFGMDPGELWEAARSTDRLDPRMPNWQLLFAEFFYNSEWQHLDVMAKLLQTIVMAFVGTLFAALVAFPLCFLAAGNITRNRLTNWLIKRCFDLLRSIDMLIWALFFVRGFGPGPIPGIAAIFFTDTGTLGKTGTEALENIDDKPREGMQSVGASPANVQRFGVVPQVLPVFLGQVLYFWESNTRSATIIGAVGAGGIGLKLIEAMRTNQDWENVAYMVLLILVVVYVFDTASAKLRARLTGAPSEREEPAR